MKAVIVVIGLIVGAAIILLSKIVTLKKKGLVYKYLEKDKKLTGFDYVTKYDGNWFFYEIDYESMLNENKSDTEFILSEKKSIALFSRIVFFLFFSLLAFSTAFKLAGFV